MALPVLRRLGFRLEVSFAFRDARVRQVLRLMLPVTIGLGLINFNVLINSTLGSLVSDDAPRAIDAAFRIYMLPQGMFSVAIATVLFPALSRFAARRDYDGLRALMANGMRQIFLLLVPAAAATLALSEPITRLIYQHGRFGHELDRPGLERAVLVLVLVALQRRQPAAHADLLQPAEAVDHHGHRGPEPLGQRRRVGRALQALRDRGDRRSAPGSPAR